MDALGYKWPEMTFTPYGKGYVSVDANLFHAIPLAVLERVLPAAYGRRATHVSAEEWVWGPCEPRPDWNDLCGKLERGEPVEGSPAFRRFVYCD